MPCCTKGSLRTHVAYQFRVRAFSALSERWGPWSPPSEATTPSILLESLPSRPELKPLKGLAIEAEWSPPVVGKKAKVAGYEVQWAQVGSQLEWSAERQARTAKEFCTTAALRQGKCYTFRVRAMIKTYAGSEWTAWSPAAAPCRTYRDLPPEHGGDAEQPGAARAVGWGGRGGDEAREPTESVIEAQLEQEMTVYESYIVGMLTNLKQLPVDRIHNMLKVGCSLRARPAAAHASPHTCPLPALTPG